MLAASYPVRVDDALSVVAFFAMLFTGRCPPFRFDMGGTDPGSTLSLGSMPEPCDIR